MKKSDILSRVLLAIDKNTERPEKFLGAQNEVEKDLRKTLKTLYDFTKKKTLECGIKNNFNDNVYTLPELVIADVDEENIWQQLELQNEEVIPDLIVDIADISAKNNLSKLSVSKQKNRVDDDEDNEGDENENNDNGDGDGDDSDEHDENQEENIPDFDENFSGDEEEMDSSSEIDRKEQKSKKAKSKPKYKKCKPSIVDDKFFKLNKLDEFLTIEDKKEFKDKPDSDSEKDSEDESINLFENYPSDDDDNAKDIKYADFFDSPDEDDDNNVDNDVNNSNYSDDNDDDDEEQGNVKSEKRKITQKPGGKNKRVKFNLDADSYPDDNDGDNTDKTEENVSTEMKSTLDYRTERAEKKISQLETENIGEKSWSLKGEIKGDDRPTDALLEDYLDYDVGSKPAPVMTETTNVKLEDIIKQRIKDNAWDDVERKIKPIETPAEYKKKLVMDQEKSKKSLAEIYEDAYLKQKQTLDPDSEERQEEESKEFKEIRKGIQLVIRKLDALSNYHCTPKQAQPDVKIISNLPAINMEEVAPVATADATLLAPEEIQGKKRGDLIGESERTDTDKSRQRRKKKKVQRLKQKAMEQKKKECNS